MSKTYKATYTPPPVTVELSAAEANCIAIQRICDVFGWNCDWRIEFDHVVKTVDANTSHSFQYVEKVKPASDADIIIFNIIQKLQVSI
jgi:hypothetical protein